MGDVQLNQVRVRLSIVLLSPLKQPVRMNIIRRGQIQTLLTFLCEIPAQAAHVLELAL